MDKYTFVSTAGLAMDYYADNVTDAYNRLRQQHPRKKFRVKEVSVNDGPALNSVREMRILENARI